MATTTTEKPRATARLRAKTLKGATTASTAALEGDSGSTTTVPNDRNGTSLTPRGVHGDVGADGDAGERPEAGGTPHARPAGERSTAAGAGATSADAAGAEGVGAAEDDGAGALVSAKVGQTPREVDSPTVVVAEHPHLQSHATEIRTRLTGLENTFAGIFKEVLAIGDLFAAAQRAHIRAREAAPESIPASFAKSMAELLDRSPSFVEKYLRISRIDVDRRALILAHPRIASDLTAVLEVARAADVETAGNLVISYEEGGRPAFNDVLESHRSLAAAMKADERLRMTMREVVDPRRPLGGVNPDLPLPPELVARFPALEPYATVGALRRAVIAAGGKTVGRRAPTGAPGVDPAKVARLVELGVEEPDLTVYFSQLLLRRSQQELPDSRPVSRILYPGDGARPVEIPAFSDLGELRATARAAGFTQLRDHEAEGRQKHQGTGVAGVMVRLAVGLDQKVSLRSGTVQLRLQAIIVPRAALERALAETVEPGDDEASRRRHNQPPIDGGTVVLTIR
jgi:hypothetical protein